MKKKPDLKTMPPPGETPDEWHIADQKIYRAMVNNITDHAVILTDKAGRIISLNKGVELILQYNDSEVRGKSIAIFYPPRTPLKLMGRK